MKSKGLLKLIRSSKLSEEKIADKIISHCQKKKGILNIRFEEERTLFHMLVLNKKADVIKKLLQNVDLRVLAFIPDKQGENLIHYAVKNKDYKNILKLLGSCLRELLDQANSMGDTPLHLALKMEQVWAVKCLVDAEASRAVRDGKGQTSFELAASNPNLKSALMHLDLKHKLFLDPRKQADSSDSSFSEELLGSFPLLSTPRGSTCSSASDPEENKRLGVRKLPSFIGLASRNLKAQREEIDEEEEKEELSETNIVDLFKELMASYNSSFFRFVKLKSEICAICNKVDLSEYKSELEELIFNFKDKEELVYDLLTDLYPLLHKHHDEFQTKCKEKIDGIADLVIQEMTIDQTDLTLPQFPIPDYSDKVNIKRAQEEALYLETIWLITAGLSSVEGERKIVLQRIINQALGLQKPFEKLLIGITKLYPTFDKHQKLVAHYIVCQLTIYNGHNSFLGNKKKINMRLRFFANCHTNKEFGLGERGKDLANQLSQLEEFSTSFYEPLLKNYDLLKQWYERIYAKQPLQSFEKLVDKALTKGRVKKTLAGEAVESLDDEALTGETDEIELIARELIVNTRAFYRAVPIDEFYNQNWMKPAETCAPGIKRQMKEHDQLGQFFTKKILDLPSEKITDGIRVLIHLAKASCHLESKVDSKAPIDLNTAFIFEGVLNRHQISRLAPYFKALNAGEIKLRCEIEELLSPLHNSKWQRECFQHYEIVLPYISIFLKDFVFGKDGNAHLISRAEIIGKIILVILKLKTQFQFELNDYNTDLPSFLSRGLLDGLDMEDHLDLISYRIYPRPQDQIDLDSKLDLEETIEKLYSNFLSKDLLPCCKVGDEVYPPNQLAQQLIELFKKLVDSYKEESSSTEPSKTNTETKKVLLRKLVLMDFTLDKILKIYHDYYYKKIDSTFLRPFLLKRQLRELKETIKAIENKQRRKSTSNIDNEIFKSLEGSSTEHESGVQPDKKRKHKRTKSGTIRNKKHEIQVKEKESRIKEHESEIRVSNPIYNVGHHDVRKACNMLFFSLPIEISEEKNKKTSLPPPPGG